MALAAKNPQLAWDQLMLMVDNQDAHSLPTRLTMPGWCEFCKPPIHGWALRCCCGAARITPAPGRDLRPFVPLDGLVVSSRDSDGDGIPQYHHGNDSGWDNCTAFEVGRPSKPPTCPPIWSCRWMLSMSPAGWAGRTDPGLAKRADRLLQRLLEHSWRGDRFVALVRAITPFSRSDTLFLLFTPGLGPAPAVPGAAAWSPA
jgi:hypothetical protein